MNELAAQGETVITDGEKTVTLNTIDGRIMSVDEGDGTRPPTAYDLNSPGWEPAKAKKKAKKKASKKR